ncbi:MAG: hypothetical protein HKN43_14930, partial [Rhodothermales bacterium]|nr:hypothetical protein [Rhodothermales bacterium]
MKVAPGGNGDYVDLEALWKPIHQERVNTGKILGWFVYQVGSPSGSEVHHNYVVITLYPSFDALQGSYPEGIWAEVYPDMEWEDVMARTLAARDHVRGETWGRVEHIPDTPTAEPAPILQVAYMKVPDGGAGQYRELENLWKKMHAVRIAEGSMLNWGVYRLRFPSGSNT